MYFSPLLHQERLVLGHGLHRPAKIGSVHSYRANHAGPTVGPLDLDLRLAIADDMDMWG
jgi:hypothetical protein